MGKEKLITEPSITNRMQCAVDWRQTVQFVNRDNDDYLNKFDSLIWNDVEHVIGNKI